MNYYFGCDPGWTNLAYAYVDEDLKLVETGVVVPKDFDAPDAYPTATMRMAGCDDIILGAAMERFVYYDGIHNPNSEQILMVTGQMQYGLYDEFEVVPDMYKAYDWKSRLSKYLFKQGFRNPSESLDKEFSIAAAEFIFECKFETDHEADAACLAFMAGKKNA